LAVGGWSRHMRERLAVGGRMINDKSNTVKFFVWFCSILFFIGPVLHAQDPAAIVKQIREKLEKVNDYEADALLKTDISFLKVPDAKVKIYYKKPDKIKIKNENGISLVPKETVSISLYSLLNSHYQALDGGTETLQGITVKVIKLLPADENGELVLAVLYIDMKRMLVLKARTTTRENGTDEVTLDYGKFLSASLPDKIVFSFNTQDFKLPKGVTFDYDDGAVKKKAADTSKNQRGKIEITYLNYSINKGLPDELFR
jgi:outer membrane lipoprotein-sorting protein